MAILSSIPRLWRIPFADLGITPAAIQPLLGGGAVADEINELLPGLLEQAGRLGDAVGGLVLHPIALAPPSTLLAGGVRFDVKKVVFEELRGAEQGAFFACTAGPGLGDWSRELMKEGDLLAGYLVDLIGSVAVETAMDRIQGDLEREMAEQGLKITNRYSPGYCGWDVAEQHQLFSLLPPAFCGITLTESALMTPVKSISGVIGVGAAVERRSYTCEICTAENCFYRNRRRAL